MLCQLPGPLLREVETAWPVGTVAPCVARGTGWQAGLRGAVKAGALSLLSLLGVLWDTCCPPPKSGTAPWVVDRHSPTPPWPWPVVRKYRFVRNRKCRCVISPVWVYPEAGRELGFEGKGQWRCGLPGHIPDA